MRASVTFEVLIDDQPMECATFGLHELQEARLWIDCKVAFYSPVAIDLFVTVTVDDGYECSELIPDYNSISPVVGSC